MNAEDPIRLYARLHACTYFDIRSQPLAMPIAEVDVAPVTTDDFERVSANKLQASIVYGYELEHWISASCLALRFLSNCAPHQGSPEDGALTLLNWSGVLQSARSCSHFNPPHPPPYDTKATTSLTPNVLAFSRSVIVAGYLFKYRSKMIDFQLRPEFIRSAFDDLLVAAEYARLAARTDHWSRAVIFAGVELKGVAARMGFDLARVARFRPLWEAVSRCMHLADTEQAVRHLDASEWGLTPPACAVKGCHYYTYFRDDLRLKGKSLVRCECCEGKSYPTYCSERCRSKDVGTHRLFRKTDCMLDLYVIVGRDLAMVKGQFEEALVGQEAVWDASDEVGWELEVVRKRPPFSMDMISQPRTA